MILKLKYKQTGIEITDKDIKSMQDFMTFWISLSHEERKIIGVLMGGVTGGLTLSICAMIHACKRHKEKED